MRKVLKIIAICAFIDIATFPNTSAREIFTQRRVRRSIADRILAFNQTWGEDPWAHTLGNPCRGEPTPPDWALDRVLNVTGRAIEIYRMIRSINSQIDHMTELMLLPECSGLGLDNLPPIPTLDTQTGIGGEFTEDNLFDLYERFYLLSVYFKIMHRDWVQGRTCNADPEETFPRIHSVSSSFRRAVCLLMIAADPHPYAAPYPDAKLWTLHGKWMKRKFFHFQDCSYRGMRDCVVIHYAKELLNLYQAYVYPIMESEESATKEETLV